MENSIHLSPDQLQALQQGDAINVREAGIECVLLRADIFERIKAVVPEDSWTPEEMRALAEALDEPRWMTQTRGRRVLSSFARRTIGLAKVRLAKLDNTLQVGTSTGQIRCLKTHAKPSAAG